MFFWNSKWICCNPLQKMSPQFCLDSSMKMVSRKASQHWFQVHLEELEQVLVLHVDEVKDRFEMFRDLLWACGNPAKFENETQHTEQLRPRVPKQCWKSCRSIASSASKQLAPVAAFPSIISEVWTIVSDLAKWKMFGPAVSPVRLTGCSVWNNKRETIWFHTLPPSQPLCFQEGQSSSTFWKLVQWVVSHRFSLTGSFTSCLTDIDSVRTRVRGREASGQTGRT